MWGWVFLSMVPIFRGRSMKKSQLFWCSHGQKRVLTPSDVGNQCWIFGLFELKPGKVQAEMVAAQLHPIRRSSWDAQQLIWGAKELGHVMLVDLWSIKNASIKKKHRWSTMIIDNIIYGLKKMMIIDNIILDWSMINIIYGLSTIIHNP